MVAEAALDNLSRPQGAHSCRTTLNVETCTRELKSQPVLNSITILLPLALTAYTPTIIGVFVASCFNRSSSAQHSAAWARDVCSIE